MDSKASGKDPGKLPFPICPCPYLYCHECILLREEIFIPEEISSFEYAPLTRKTAELLNLKHPFAPRDDIAVDYLGTISCFSISLSCYSTLSMFRTLSLHLFK